MFTNVGKILVGGPQRIGHPTAQTWDVRTAAAACRWRLPAPPGNDSSGGSTSSGPPRISSITSPTFGNQSETGIPDFPYCLKVRRIGITGRFIGALLSPNPMASMILPACLLSLGSKVSMWLTPPHMNR